MRTLEEWLKKIADEQPAEMILGLDRVKKVAERLHLLTSKCPVIIVGGTNGKGSTVATLEAVYKAAGYHVGTFTSPILFKHNEYVHIDGVEVSDELFCQVYEKIAVARAEVPLTPFEYHTLAALWIFTNLRAAMNFSLDIIILEVGLGGRLDAVNIIDADVAIVTSIDIDHADWLGDTREKIGFEKAGIFRKGKFAICGDENPPQSLLDHAKEIGAHFLLLEMHPCLKHAGMTAVDVCHPASFIKSSNIACALKAIELLQNKLPVDNDTIATGLKNIKITGRVQVIPGDITEIYDVSHNPASVANLAMRLAELKCAGKTVAVFSMLADKDIAGSIQKISPQIDEWYIAPLPVNRGADLAKLKAAFSNKETIFEFDSIERAYLAAKTKLQTGDRLVVFGSFHTVTAILSMQK